MAIPYFEPKNVENANSNTNAAIIFDQVDGGPGTTVTAATTSAPTVTGTAFLSSQPISPPTLSTIASPIAVAHTATATTATSMNPLPIDFEQEALAWKMLALVMVKTLKKYHLQMSGP